MSQNEHSRTDQSLAESDSEILAGLLDEFTDRLNRGEQPDVDAYVRNHPQHAESLREILPALTAMRSPGDTTAPDAGESNPPRIIGEYRILREVGRGGMARVYEARHAKLQRRVALKVLAHHAGDPDMLRRFEREARAVASLHHTNIVPVYETGECDGLHYIAMQFISGGSLDRVLRHPRASTTPHMAGATASVKGQANEPQISTEGRRDHGNIAANADTSAAKPASVSPDAALWNLRRLLGLTDSENDSPDCALIAQIGQRISEAIAFAHQHGVLHRA